MKAIKLIMIGMAYMFSISGSAQQALWSGKTLISPEVNNDKTVTFRLDAPQANKVELQSEFLPSVMMEAGGHSLQGPGKAEFTKGKDGVWEFTTAQPLASELYTYSFFVDGTQITDPNNIAQVRDDNYEPTKAGRAIADFVNDNLSNWYVRLNRKRFWGGEMSDDKLSAYQTLYHCLVTITKLMAPIAPFYADRLYLDLTSVTEADNKLDSVHLDDFPQADESVIDKTLEEQMYLAQAASSIVLSLRRKVNIKVRQPLSKIMIPVADESQKFNIESVKQLILNEVNVKELLFVDSANEMLVKKVKPDFKKLGPRYGKIMKQLAVKIQEMESGDIKALESNGVFALNVDGEEVSIELNDVEILSEDIPGWLVGNEGRLTVALDITISDELRKEGIARELVNRIQNIRKANDFEITDRVKVEISSNGITNDAIIDNDSYIKSQVLADEIIIVDDVREEEIEIDDTTLTISVYKNS